MHLYYIWNLQEETEKNYNEWTYKEQIIQS
jgi:hypothetical protein